MEWPRVWLWWKPLLAAMCLLLLAQPVACTNGVPEDGNTGTPADDKVSAQLDAQVELRQQQLEDPSPERLQQMQDMGMAVDDLETQKTFIYLAEEPSPAQAEAMKALGVTLYPGSWVPPVGVHQNGFLIATVPVESLGELAALDFVVRLDTAERMLEPQFSQPQGGTP